MTKSFLFPILLSFSVFCSLTIDAQNGYPVVSNPEFFKAIPIIDGATPQWAITMYEDSKNFVKIEEEKKKYYQSNNWEKNIHTQNYKYWLKQVRDHIDEQGQVSIPKPGVEFKQGEKRKARQQNNHARSMSTWQNIGPSTTYRDGTLEKRPTQANVYCLGVAPSNHDIVYAGMETGGIFKSTDKGLSWFPVTHSYAIGNIQDIKVDPSNADIVYASRGSELYNTQDGGVTWNLIYTHGGTMEQFLIDPVTTSTMYMASAVGTYKSTDSGVSWTQKHAAKAYDIEFKPGSTDIIYIAVNNTTLIRPEIMKSVDAGETWTLKDSGFYVPSVPAEAQVYGCKIGVTPADPDRVYAGVIANGKAADNGWIGIYYSEDEGENWQEDSGFDGAPYASGSDAATNWYVAGYSSGYHQGFYNFDIDVSHNDPDKLWIGTIWFSESGNKGGNIEYIRGTRNLSMHADVQDIDVVGNDIWVASDGGINYSNDEFLTVETRMDGITASDFWGFGMGWNEDIWVGGRYHNGNAAFHENYGIGNTKYLGGAENSTGYVNRLNNRKVHYSDVGSKKIITDLGGTTPSLPNIGKYPTESYFHFSYSELEWHPHYENISFLGSENQLFKSVDYGANFEAIYTFVGDIRRFEISRDNPDYIYAIVYVSYWDWRVYKSTDGGSSFTQINNPTLSGGSWRNVSFTLNPENKDEIWYASNSSSNGNKIFSSTDGGSTWTNRYTSVIANQNIKDLVFQPVVGGNHIYAMTDTDLFYYDTSTGDWTEYDDGLPVAHRGFMLLPFYKDNKLRMASAKGIWEAPMVASSKLDVMPMTSADTIYCERDTVQLESHSIAKHDGTTWTWTISPVPSYIEDVNLRNPKVVLGADGSYDVTLQVALDDGQSSSITVEDMLFVDTRCAVDTVPDQAFLSTAEADYAFASNVNLTDVTHFTVSGWWKPNGSQDGFAALFSSGNWCAHCDDTEGLIFDYWGSRLWYKWSGTADTWASNSGMVIPLDEWSYVALVIEPEKATLYLNEEKHEVIKTHLPADIESFYFGRGHYSNSLRGEIDEVTIWNRALSEDEIWELRYLTKENQIDNDPDLIAYYQFNDVVNGSTIQDHANFYHAVLTNNATITQSEAPVGAGESKIFDLQTDVYNYTSPEMNTELILSDCVKPSGKLVLSKVNQSSLLPPDGSQEIEAFWSLNHYGEGSFPTMDTIKINPQSTIITNSTNLSSVHLNTRSKDDADSQWNKRASAIENDSDVLVFDRKMKVDQDLRLSLSFEGSGAENDDPGKPCEPDTIPGKMLTLPGNGGDYVEIPVLNLNTNTLTVSTWIKPDGVQNDWAGIVFCRGNTTTSGISIKDDNELRYHWNGNEYGWSSGAYIIPDEWNHVAWVISPTAVIIYLNGIPYTQSTNHPEEAFDAIVRIGNDAGFSSRTFKGEIDELVIWNRVVSQDELRLMKHLTKEDIIEMDDDLIVYYQFNEDGDDIFDKSGFLHNGNMSGNVDKDSLSNVPVGGGVSESINVNTTGIVSTDVGLDFMFSSGATLPDGEVVFSKINLNPDVNPDDNPTAASYWIVNNYGNNSSISGLEEISFYGTKSIFDNTSNTDFQLNRRVENGAGPLWNIIQKSQLVDQPLDKVTYNGGISITSFDTQFSLSNSAAKGWIGVKSREWSDNLNWGGGIIPSPTDNVIIPAHTPYSPLVNVNTMIRSLVMHPNALLSVMEAILFDIEE